MFFKKHKALTIILAVILALILAVGVTVLYYLNKINYNDGTNPELMTTSQGEASEDDEDLLNNSDSGLSADELDALGKADSSISQNLGDNQVWYNDNVMNILLMGIDYGSASFPYGRSDAMMVLSINKETNKIKLVSFSRAVYVSIEGHKNTRLNHAHGYGGPTLAIKTIEQNYKIRIDNYVSTGFDTFKELINILDGVNVNLTAEEAKALNATFGTFSGAGSYTLNGDQALAYVRLRKIDSDRDRTGRQRNVITAIIEKARGMSVSQGIEFMNKILPLVNTDLTKTELLRQATSAMSYLNWDISQDVIPNKSSGLVLRGNFEVLLLNWPEEIEYAKNCFYGDVIPSYETIS